MIDDFRLDPEKGSTSVRPHYTRTGRVVYNRRMHPFTVRDWARIGRKVPPPRDFDEAIHTVGICFELVQSLANYLFGWMPQYRVGKLIYDSLKDILWQALDKMIDENKDNNAYVEAVEKARAALAAL